VLEAQIQEDVFLYDGVLQYYSERGLEGDVEEGSSMEEGDLSHPFSMLSH